MVERQLDDQGRWEYPITFPGQDAQKHPLGVRIPSLVEAIGLDGRFLGAVRSFPGFADSTQHKVPKVDVGTSVRNSSFFWVDSTAAAADIWYVTADGGADPGISDPNYFFDTVDTLPVKEVQSKSTDLANLTPGEWGYGDIDSLGFDTIYWYNIVDPDSRPLDALLYGSTHTRILTGITFAKYASVQKGISRHTFKGIAMIADNRDGSNKSVYFAYRDSSDGTTDVYELEDLDRWRDLKVTAINDVDITSSGKYLYVSISGATTSTISTFNNKEMPYNKAYYWDFKVNTWDTFNAGWQGRITGVLPERVLSARINAGTDSPRAASSTVMASVTVTSLTSYTLPKGNYTFAAQPISRKHRMRGPLRWFSRAHFGTSDTSLKFSLAGSILPSNDSLNRDQLRHADGDEDTTPIYWGMSHMDGWRLYRSVAAVYNAQLDNYDPVDQIFLLSPYISREAHGSTGASDPDLFIHADEDNLGSNHGFVDAGDAGLPIREQYDPYQDEVGPMPRMKRITSYAGLLVGITDVEEPTTPDDIWAEADQRPEEIAWTTTTVYEPENFPVANRVPSDDAAEKFLSLESGGDHCFAISTGAVYRITRSGARVAVNKLQFKLGGLSRYGQTGVANSLYIITESGCKEIDGNTGEVQSVRALDRIMTDDADWAGTLDTVQVGYDATIGALCFLNNSKKEMVFLWEATGAVTRLIECPWAFLLDGKDVATDGPHRIYLLSSTGVIHTVDGARTMGKNVMCGAASGDTVNGTVTSASGTQLIDSTATFPTDCLGFYVHFLSGDLEGNSYVIGTRVGNTTLTLDSPGTTVIGDRYSIAPVFCRGTLAALYEQHEATPFRGAVDLFKRKVTRSISVSLDNLSGEVGGDDTNGEMILGFRNGTTILASGAIDLNVVPDKMTLAHNVGGTKIFPYFEVRGSNIDFQISGLLVHGVGGISEVQSRQA